MELIEEIEKHYRKNIEPITDDELKELEFLQKFTATYKKENLMSILNIDKKDYLLATLCIINDREQFTKLKEDINKLKNLNNIAKIKPLKKIIDLIMSFEEKNLLTELSEIPLLSTEDGQIEKIVTEHKKNYKKFYKENLIDPLSELHVLMNKFIVENEEGRKIFFELIDNYTTEFFASLLSLATLIHAKENLNGVKNPEEIKMHEKILESSAIYEIFDDIEKRKEYLSKKVKKNQKLLSEKEKLIQIITKKVKQMPHINSIKITDELLEILPTEKSKLILLKKALFQNRTKYQQIKPQLLIEEEKEDYEKIFKKYVYDFEYLDEYSKKLLNDFGNKEKILKLLKLLKNKNFTFFKQENFPIIEVLINTDETIVEYIIGLLTQGIITEDFVYNNPEIFIKNIKENLKEKLTKIKNEKYNTLSNNIDLLKQKKINTHSKNIEEILLTNTNILKTNIEILEQYNFPYQLLETYNILKNNSLNQHLDKFIELGLYRKIQENPNIIDNNIHNIINKILLCKQLEIPITDEKLNKIFTEKNLKIGSFIIAEENIKEYLDYQTYLYENIDCYKAIEKNENAKINTNYELDKLKEYKQDNLTYNFNGILISRNKVLRNYNILNNHNLQLDEQNILFNAIIHNSFLLSNEIEQINNIIFNKNKAKEKR